MRRTITIGVAVLALLAMMAGATAAPVTTIDFEQDRRGSVRNGFTSADSLSVAFRDSRGRDLEIRDFGRQSHGKALAANWDDPSALIMDIRHPVGSITFWFGNDDPSWTRPGDRAVLTVFKGDRRVGRVSVRMNRNDRMDQWISYDGRPFDRAVFLYDADRRGGLIEIVDDIVIAPLTG